MQLTRAEKERQIKELSEKINKASSVVVWDHTGLSVGEFNTIRQVLKDNNCETKIYKNTLARIAFKENKHDEASESIEGVSSFGFAFDADANVSKVLFDSLKEIKRENEALKFGIVEEAFQDKDSIRIVATLPSKNELLSMLLSVLQAPMRNMALATKLVAEKAEN